MTEKRQGGVEAGLSSPSIMNAPTVVTATAGASNAVGALAKPLYMQSRLSGNHRKRAVNARAVCFRSANGQHWCFHGKIGRVLHMLATLPQGITQWDTLPWHTRLGASVHALREAGLSIDTKREGECRHARYILRTLGYLLLSNNVEVLK
jgi:hypothetical protein